jgi:cell wall-associated NlpC family hydrolase
MKKLSILIFILSLSLGARECDIEVSYHRNKDGTVILHVQNSSNCKMSVLLTEDGSDIKFTPTNYKRSKKASTKVKIKLPDQDQNELIDKIISIAKSKVGSKYKPGATGPDSFDCSGFVYYVFRKAGIKIPRVSTNQAKIGPKLSREELKKGDIVCFDTANRGRVNHTGIYLGNGRFIHSSSGRAYSVTVSNLNKGFYKDKFKWGVRVVK